MTKISLIEALLLFLKTPEENSCNTEGSETSKNNGRSTQEAERKKQDFQTFKIFAKLCTSPAMLNTLKVQHPP